MTVMRTMIMNSMTLLTFIMISMTECRWQIRLIQISNNTLIPILTEIIEIVSVNCYLMANKC